MQVTIDSKSGFCFGVKNAISLAENELSQGREIYSLGDIVHNEEEVARLEKLGMKVIGRETFKTLKNCTVLIRAHGEPPETYSYAAANNIRLIEGTCPVVLKLQEKIRKKNAELSGEGTLVIFGKPEHPEVIGLNGQVGNKAVIVQTTGDFDRIDFSKPVKLFAQTTMERQKYIELRQALEEKIENKSLLDTCDSICGQVANRGPWLESFSKTVDAVIFVGGTKSSNSKVLYGHCKKANPNSFFVSSPEEIYNLSLESYKKTGVCGATSTPLWLMETIANAIRNKYPDE
ncbi:MAG: 4-hydroxy-3-methylbut-2-enyl diphosphate reductase [Bacteroidales bacterium]|nr:4-hydroxy-3-methylbut-2-enyl diphosphate reductase [Bacteroidales bacterium]